MKNAFLFSIIFSILSFAFAKKTTAAVPSKIISHKFFIQQDSTQEIDNEYIIQKIAAKNKILSLLKTSRVLANISIACIPASIITIGISFLVGFVTSIIAVVEMLKVSAILDDYPELKDDPSIKNRLLNNTLRVGIIGGIYGIFLLLFLFLLIQIGEFTNTSGVSFTAFLGFISFLLLDTFSFKTKKKVKK